jgi:hypothetical protein
VNIFVLSFINSDLGLSGLVARLAVFR